MRIAVTGGAGFIGSNFIRHLLREHPDDDVVVLDKLTYAGSTRNLEGVAQDPRFRFVRMDVCDPAVTKIVKDFDAVVHFAAETHVDRSIEDPSPFVRTNVEGTWRMVDACRENNVSRFVHVSTDEVYGSLGPQGKSVESSPLAPTSPYAASKAAADLIVLAAVKTFGFPAIVTRCSNNYGPYQFPEKFIPLMISQALANQPLPVYGDGRNVRDWIHVADHCRALDQILRGGREGEIYNIGGGCEIENKAVARRILQVLDRPESLLRFVTDRPAHDRRYALDCTKLHKELGWQPQWDFEPGLLETIRWYQENPVWLEEARSRQVHDHLGRYYVRRENTSAVVDDYTP